MVNCLPINDTHKWTFRGVDEQEEEEEKEDTDEVVQVTHYETPTAIGTDTRSNNDEFLTEYVLTSLS
jgi:hypothetical protein